MLIVFVTVITAIIWVIQENEFYITFLLYIDILIIWKKKNYKKLKIKIYDSKSIILNGKCNIHVNNSLTKTIFQSILSFYNLQFHSSINNNELCNAIYWLTVFKYRVSVTPFLIRIRKWMTISNLWVTKITQHMT